MVNRIIEAIDEELDRLLRAREILAAYAEDTSVGPREPRSKRKQKHRRTVEAAASSPEVKVTILPPKPEQKRRGRALKSPEAEPRALTSRIPLSPVAVAPAHVRPETPSSSEGYRPSYFGARILAEERNLGARTQS